MISIIFSCTWCLSIRWYTMYSILTVHGVFSTPPLILYAAALTSSNKIGIGTTFTEFELETTSSLLGMVLDDLRGSVCGGDFLPTLVWAAGCIGVFAVGDLDSGLVNSVTDEWRSEALDVRLVLLSGVTLAVAFWGKDKFHYLKRLCCKILSETQKIIQRILTFLFKHCNQQ